MKKVYKTGIIITVVGIALAGIGALGVCLNPDLSHKAVEKYKTKNKIESVENTYTSEEFQKVKKIDISLDMAYDNVEIKKSSNNEARILAENVYSDNYQCYIDDDETLVVSETYKKISFQISTLGFGIGFDSKIEKNITIELPEKEYDNIYAFVSCSDVEISNFEAENLTLNIDTGNAELNNISSKDSVAVSVDIGDIDINNLKSENMAEIFSDTGDITVSDSEFENVSVSIDSAGDIKITDSEIKGTEKDSNIDISVDTGNIKTENTKITAVSNISVDVGSIDMNISGNIENYTITTKVDVGDCTIDGDNTNSSIGNESKYQINASIDVGDIDISFN
jgi:hypothetical protein